MSKNKSSASKIKFRSFEDLMEEINSGPSIIPDGTTKMSPRDTIIPIDKLKPFKNHPFKVIHNAKMDALIDSIKTNGVIEPIVVRCKGDLYEIVSGHRRTYAAEKAELKKIPCKIIEADDAAAIKCMVDSNLYRETFLPSEKAFSYKMKLDAMKHQGKKTSAQNVEKGLSVDKIGEENGESRETIRRYIRLTYLIPELLRMVDEDKLKFIMAVDISYLTEEMQRWLYEDVLPNQAVKPAQIAALRKYLEKSALDRQGFVEFFVPCNKAVTAPKQISTAKIPKDSQLHYDKVSIESALENLLNLIIIVKQMLEEMNAAKSVNNKHEMIAFSEAITAIEGASVSDMAKNALTQWADGKLSYEDAIRIVLEHYGFPKQS